MEQEKHDSCDRVYLGNTDDGCRWAWCKTHECHCRVSAVEASKIRTLPPEAHDEPIGLESRY